VRSLVGDRPRTRTHDWVPFLHQIYRGRRSVASALSFTVSVGKKLSSLREHYDLVELNMSPMLHFSLLPLMRRVGATRGARIIGMMHEVWQEYWSDYAGLVAGKTGKMLERYSSENLDLVLTISEFNKRRLLRWRVEPAKVKVVRPGVDYEDIIAAPPSAVSSDLVYVGRLVPDHHLERLVMAVKTLREKYHTDVRTIITGGGPEMQRLKDMASELGLAERITFSGIVEQRSVIYSLLKSSRIYVFPSSPHGGWNISCLEGNAAGLPIVCLASTEIGTARELVEEGVNGITVPEPSPDRFADAINSLLQNESHLRAMSALSVKHAEKFSWPKVCEQTLRIYEELVGGRTQARATPE